MMKTRRMRRLLPTRPSPDDRGRSDEALGKPVKQSNFMAGFANLSLLKQGKVKGIRFDTLAAICQYLDCQPGDILEFEPGASPAPGDGTET